MGKKSKLKSKKKELVITEHQIDQSGKIEQTNFDTAICLSNGTWDSIFIEAKTKRQIQEIFRRTGQIRNYVIFTFCAALTFIIERNIKVGRIVIDQEYYGKEPIIKKLLGEMSRKIKETATLDFGLVGKSSRVHILAAEVFAKRKEPGQVLNKEQLLKLIRKTEVGKQLKDA